MLTSPIRTKCNPSQLENGCGLGLGLGYCLVIVMQSRILVRGTVKDESFQ